MSKTIRTLILFGAPLFVGALNIFHPVHFGQTGLYAAYLVGAAFAALMIYMIMKLTLQLAVFVIIPAAISAFILTYFLPYDFQHLLPATAALFTLGLVLRHTAFSKA